MGKNQRKKGKKGTDDGIPDDTQESIDARQSTASPFARERRIWIVVSGLLLIACVVMFFYTWDARRQLSDYDYNLVNCMLALDEANLAKDEAQMEMRKAQDDLKGLSLGYAGEQSIPEEYIKEFQSKGVSRPVAMITSDLYGKKELIPYKASASNRNMRFNNRNQIYLISPNRVLAYFTDGTIFGWMFLQYRVKEGGDISWKIIESYCPYYDK
ncbi:MAG: hypothetical protein CVT49_13770 [candidate division Zixibacteria bacterium HGW-Zixibacteria-1]|nr:MAG: hypothetical protein CVT49_13770 [candidate division Zixibacteria bacterium HGW-Zixibacteria-1]